MQAAELLVCKLIVKRSEYPGFLLSRLLMADKANITPEVLKWARTSARITEEDAARRAAVPIAKLQLWENGEAVPTIKQARNLAKFYRRPFALFFLPDIPNDFEPLQDFRRKGSVPLGTASIFIIREIQRRQAWLQELIEESGEDRLPYVGRFSVNDSPEEIAQHILQTLEIDPLNYENDDPMRVWINRTETKGVFVSRTSSMHSRMPLDPKEIQGFAIADKYAPFVFINTRDWRAAQLFTLVHELAHIWIAASGISIDVDIHSSYGNNIHPVEILCNQVAAHALMPQTTIERHSISEFRSIDSIYRIARLYGVSSFAFIVRLRNLELINQRSYRSLAGEAETRFREHLEAEARKQAQKKQSENTGGPSPYLLRVNKNSRQFTRIVLDSFRQGAVDPALASTLLETPTTKFSKLEVYL